MKRYKPIKATLKSTDSLIAFCFFLFRRFSSVIHWLVLNKSWNAIHIFPNPQSNKNTYCPQGSTNPKTISIVWGDQVTKNRNMAVSLQMPYIVKANIM